MGYLHSRVEVLTCMRSPDMSVVEYLTGPCYLIHKEKQVCLTEIQGCDSMLDPFPAAAAVVWSDELA